MTDLQTYSNLNKQSFADHLKSYCKDNNINDNNYAMATLNTPYKLNQGKKQLKYLTSNLINLKTNLICIIEWTQLKANGYYMHTIINTNQIEQFKQLNWHISTHQNCLSACINFLSKPSNTKQLYKVKFYKRKKDKE